MTFMQNNICQYTSRILGKDNIIDKISISKTFPEKSIFLL